MLGNLQRFGKLAILNGCLAALLSCGGGGGGLNLEGGVFGPSVSGTPDSFRGAGIVNDGKFLFGGPLAQGRDGDILLQNDKIRIILQKPTRNTGVGLFGGNIIDADLFRPSAEGGKDQFGTMFPLVNLSWTVNYQRLEIINADFANGPVVVRATGILDVYDYIQTNIITPFAKIFVGADLYFSTRFDDIFNPFKNVPELKGLNPIIVTEYTLKSDANYVIIETRFQNDGEVPLKMPVGDWLNGSGTLEPFVPRKGFVRGAQIDPIAAMVYQAMEENVGVSYGYFYNPLQFMKDDGTLHTSTALTVSGVTPVVLGEGLLQVLPLNGGEGDVKVNFTIEPGSRTITRYFVVGKGDAASVIDGGFQALGVSKLRLSGVVKDAGGDPVAKARVVAIDTSDPEPANHVPVTVAFSDEQGNFSADLSSGRDVKDKMFGSGTYTIHVYKEGYAFAGGPKAGKCSGGSLDSGTNTVSGVVCSLGETGSVSVSATEDGAAIPARVTVVGFEPSPTHPYGQPPNFGLYADVNLEEKPYGIVDLLYLDPSGNLAPRGHHRLIGGNQFRLEPGEYEIYVTRGPEYSVYKQRVTVPPGGSVAVNAELKKVLDT
ncbi:MAG: carboxypeptidase regulatory-like domain-containing protein, partial [Deltaproteobacteria bacterium]|nr:carboxypeptidase regulatory-like domain-containing protein [Deltaproteobacteria bacterium]